MINLYSKFSRHLEKNQNFILFGFVVYVFISLGFYWVYKLNIMPGLHADEAWSGLKAYYFQKQPIDQLTGMNNYTGILQILIAKLSFNLLNLGVMQLRLGGIVFNLLGLLIIFYVLNPVKWRKRSIIFFLVFTQSSLFVISPRVAWEVNTFTLFFFSLGFISFVKIKENSGKVSFFWAFLFLLSNLLGTYNHILFSCLPISAFVGMVLWNGKLKSRRYVKLTILLAINAINLIVLFLAMNYVGNPLKVPKFLILLGILTLIAGGSIIYFKLIRRKWATDIQFNLNTNLINLIVIFSIGSFTIFHGIAFVQVVSSYKMILQVYSYECTTLVEVFLNIIGCSIVGIFVMQIVKDLRSNQVPLMTFIVITYMGLFSFYTISVSLRYYLILYILMAIYLAYNGSRYKQTSIFLLCVSVAGFFTVQGLIVDILTSKDLHFRAIDFRIGNRQKETSAHFLPKQPVMYFLKANKIGEIEFLNDDPYFIREPLLFYKTINPFQEIKENKAFIDFDFTKYNIGFLLYTKDK